MTIRLLSFDPGQKNCSFAIVESSSKSVNSLKVMSHGLLPANTTNLELKTASKVRQQILNLQETLLHIQEKYSPTHLILERYMTRGFGGGSNTTEVINFLIGCIVAQNIAPVKLIGASTWKNEVKRHRIKQGLSPQRHKHTCNKVEVYAGFETAKAIVPVSAHQVDACYIAAYGLALLRKAKPFAEFDFDAFDKKIICAEVDRLCIAP